MSAGAGKRNTSTTTTPSGGRAPVRCLTCEAVVAQKDLVVSCSKCNGKLHHGCYGFSDENYKFYAKLPVGLVPIYCTPCKTALDGLEARVAALESASTAASGLSEELVTTLITRVLENVLPKVLEASREAASEAVEAEGKKLNLVLINLPENEAHVDVVESACEKLHINRADVLETFRDGRPSADRPRIVKIKFKNSNSRREFLMGFRNVRSALPGGANAWVRPDLTYRQRQSDFVLRKELYRRKEGGEENLKIHRGKIVAREEPKE